MSAAPDHEAVMSGHGYYNQHSVVQAAAAELGMAALADAAASVPLAAAPFPVTIADYGCSQGQNSLRPMGVAVGALRARTDGPLVVVHTDLPGNDFAAVFEAVAHDPASYVGTDGAVYALAAGRSFYGEVLPPGTVALGWSAITTHWLSEVPAAVPGHVSAHLSDDPVVRDAFRQRARADWASFLDARAAELVPGGRMVLVEPSSHPDGRTGSESLLGLVDEVLGELVDRGEVSAAEVAATTLPVWLRVPDDYVEPVRSHPDLELVSSQVVEGLRSPLWVRFEQDGDAEAYAEASVATLRAWSEAMLSEVIADPAALDDLYQRCRQLGATDPERLHLQVFHVVLDLGRA